VGALSALPCIQEVGGSTPLSSTSKIKHLAVDTLFRLAQCKRPLFKRGPNGPACHYATAPRLDFRCSSVCAGLGSLDLRQDPQPNLAALHSVLLFFIDSRVVDELCTTRKVC
jgi:hypothetical protein